MITYEYQLPEHYKYVVLCKECIFYDRKEHTCVNLPDMIDDIKPSDYCSRGEKQ